uniref:Putative secreted protein n=1 Tax=Ixodes ricinus TaxID=34613 RepID=A0A6B0URD5_IXORI
MPPATYCFRLALSKALVLLPPETLCIAIRLRLTLPKGFLPSPSALRRCSFRPPCIRKLDNNGGFRCLPFPAARPAENPNLTPLAPRGERRRVSFSLFSRQEGKEEILKRAATTAHELQISAKCCPLSL